MNFDINNVVRSVVFGAVALTVTVPLGSTLGNTSRSIAVTADAAEVAAEPSKASVVLDDIRNELTRACIDYRVSKQDSKLEREAKNTIDEYFDGDVAHRSICD